MFAIDIQKEVREIAEQVRESSGVQLEDAVLALMEHAMKIGILKTGLALVNFVEVNDNSEN